MVVDPRRGGMIDLKVDADGVAAPASTVASKCGDFVSPRAKVLPCFSGKPCREEGKPMSIADVLPAAVLDVGSRIALNSYR